MIPSFSQFLQKGAYWAWKHKGGTVVLEISRIPVV